jgi:Protein of unknown function (DUF2785)
MYRFSVLAVLLFAMSSAATACTNAEWPRESLLRLKVDGFRVSEDADRQSMVDALAACLASPDPELRDGIAYEGLSTLLRNNALDTQQLRNLRDELYVQLAEEDPDGVARPFAALMLSEVARTDRIAPWMDDAERGQMLARAIDYMKSVRDYRGYDPVAGWRHGVAHAADWLMQLALNPKFDSLQLRALTDAVATQVRAADGHAYIFGESGRLARPVVFAARRGIRTQEEWRVWLGSLVSGLGDPSLAYKDLNWLYARHNVSGFLDTLYLETDLSGDEALKPLQMAVVQTLKNMP